MFVHRKGYGSSDDDDEKGQSPPPKQPHPPPPIRPHTHPTHSTPPPEVSLREGPSLNTGYEKDKRLLETQEQMAEQPDAFGGIQKQTEGTLAKQGSPSKTRCSDSLDPNYEYSMSTIHQATLNKLTDIALLLGGGAMMRFLSLPVEMTGRILEAGKKE